MADAPQSTISVVVGSMCKYRVTGAIVKVTKVEDVQGQAVVFYRFCKRSEGKVEQQMILNSPKFQYIPPILGFLGVFKPA